MSTLFSSLLEQQQEEENVEEEVVKKKYSRKDERVHSWTISSLVSPPAAKKQGFMSMSDLAVFKSLKLRPKPIIFPEFLFISPNYFYQPWSLNTHRRMKNIIIALEWCPNRKEVIIAEQGPFYGTAALPTPGQPDRVNKQLQAEQEQRLKKSFDLFDTDKNGLLDELELREVLRAVEAVTPDSEAEEFAPIIKHLLATCSANRRSLNFDDVKSMMINTTHGRMQAGRFYVVVTLQEAECIRGWIHMQRIARVMLIQNAETTLGLRVGSYLLDGSNKYVPAFAYQQDTAEACLRFADADVYYTERNLALLLRALERNTLDARHEWFDDIRSCKRRQQMPWEKTSLTKIFTMHDEFNLLEHRALVSRVRTLVRIRFGSMMDAFRAMDQDRDGKLNCSELYAACNWLGLSELGPNDIYDMMRNYDSSHHGSLNYADFAKTFRDPDEDSDIYSVANAQLKPIGASDPGDNPGGMDVTNIVIPTMKIKELYDLSKEKQESDHSSTPSSPLPPPSAAQQSSPLPSSTPAAPPSRRLRVTSRRTRMRRSQQPTPLSRPSGIAAMPRSATSVRLRINSLRAHMSLPSSLPTFRSASTIAIATFSCRSMHHGAAHARCNNPSSTQLQKYSTPCKRNLPLLLPLPLLLLPPLLLLLLPRSPPLLLLFPLLRRLLLACACL